MGASTISKRVNWLKFRIKRMRPTRDAPRPVYFTLARRAVGLSEGTSGLRQRSLGSINISASSDRTGTGVPSPLDASRPAISRNGRRKNDPGRPIGSRRRTLIDDFVRESRAYVAKNRRENRICVEEEEFMAPKGLRELRDEMKGGGARDKPARACGQPQLQFRRGAGALLPETTASGPHP